MFCTKVYISYYPRYMIYMVLPAFGKRMTMWWRPKKGIILEIKDIYIRIIVFNINKSDGKIKSKLIFWLSDIW